MLQLTCCREFCNLSAIFRAKMLSCKVFDILQVWYNSKSFMIVSGTEITFVIFSQNIFVNHFHLRSTLEQKSLLKYLLVCSISLLPQGRWSWLGLHLQSFLLRSFLGANKDCQTSPEACLYTNTYPQIHKNKYTKTNAQKQIHKCTKKIHNY